MKNSTTTKEWFAYSSVGLEVIRKVLNGSQDTYCKLKFVDEYLKCMEEEQKTVNADL